MDFSSGYDPIKNTILKRALNKKVIVRDQEFGISKYGVMTSYNEKTGEYRVKTRGDLNPMGRKFKFSKLKRLLVLH